MHCSVHPFGHRVSRRLIAFAFPLAVAVPLWATPLSFEQALSLATQGAPTLAASQARVDTARAAAVPAGELPDPKLAVGVENLPVAGPDRYSLTGDFMTMQRIAYMQDIPNRSKREARVAVAQAKVQQAESAQQLSTLTVRRETAVAWIRRYALERQIALFDGLFQQNKLLESAVQAQLAGGRGAIADVLMPRQEAAMLAERLDELRTQRAQAIAALQRWIGAAAGESLEGDALVNHPGITAVSFTGSVGVGQRIAAACAGHMKKVQLEMGGKNPQVVLDDADLNVAVELSVQSAFYSTGQRCTASSRLIVTDKIYPAFIEAMQKRMAAIKVGDALAAGIDIGPVASQAQLEQDLSYVEIGKLEGATLLTGGERLTRDTEGFYMAPALLVDSTAAMRINREEIFGPVASVIRVKDYEEALATANDTPFGLSAGIATTSLKYATHFKRHSQVGMVMVNLPTAGVDYHVPFGGRKGSSYGSREQGKYAAEFFTTVKTAYTLA